MRVIVGLVALLSIRALAAPTCDKLIRGFYTRQSSAGFVPVVLDPGMGKANALNVLNGWSSHVGQEIVLRVFPKNLSELPREVHGILQRDVGGALYVINPKGEIEHVSMQALFVDQQRVLAEVKPEPVEVVREKMKSSPWTEAARQAYAKLAPEDLAAPQAEVGPAFLEMSLGLTRELLSKRGAELKAENDGYSLRMLSPPKANELSSDPKALFHEHRDFLKLYEELKAEGVQIVIENERNPARPVLYADGDQQIPAASWEAKRRQISVRSGTPFVHFAHEVEHFKFERDVYQVIGPQDFHTLQKESEQPLKDTDARLTPLLKKVLEDHKTVGIRSMDAYNEMLSYSHEVQQLRAAGYKLLDPSVRDALYLKWRNEARAMAYGPIHKAKLHAKRLALDWLTDPVVLAMVGGTVASGVALTYFMSDDEDTVIGVDSATGATKKFSLSDFANRLMDKVTKSKSN